MSKQKAPRRVGENEALAVGTTIRGSAQKLNLVAGLIRHGHRHARAVTSEEDLAHLVREQARPGDIVVCLGAGTISAWAGALPARLEQDG